MYTVPWVANNTYMHLDSFVGTAGDGDKINNH